MQTAAPCAAVMKPLRWSVVLRDTKVLLAGLDLRHGGIHQVVHRAPDLVIGLVDAAGGEVRLDLAEDIVVARFLEIRQDDGLGIGLGIGAALPSFSPPTTRAACCGALLP